MAARNQLFPGVLLTMLLPTATALSDPSDPPANPSTDDAELAVIYVYHLTDSTWAKTGGAIAMRRVVIFVDGSKAVSLGQGNHTRIVVRPGLHTLTAKTKIFALLSIGANDVKIDAQAGKSYYLHFYERNAGGGSVLPVFVEVDESEGGKAVASTKLTPAKLLQ